MGKQIKYVFINYYQQMHYIAIKITHITVFYVIIRAPICFDPSGSSSGSKHVGARIITKKTVICVILIAI